ncbi:hypothetical protein [Oscillatoria sp. FACHB-1406]|uniref:hypothetical protein n=1 Tax=Oscillatoria sp. FACHB-1406 TaxID=2692846 RepID=UPI0016879AAB|nr:hypothetical protein [Oscillatoria sp. FACHB-1406]MBD2576737.1 hypothetical protein [Oscillatoria sp. FACHB-1406]
MLDDRALLTLKAFLAAYTAQNSPPLPELSAIDADLDNRVNELDSVARNNPQLSENYQQARTLLSSAASKRKAGLYATPKPPEPRRDDSKDVENIIRIVDQMTEEELRARLRQSDNR